MTNMATGLVMLSLVLDVLGLNDRVIVMETRFKARSLDGLFATPSSSNLVIQIDSFKQFGFASFESRQAELRSWMSLLILSQASWSVSLVKTIKKK